MTSTSGIGGAFSSIGSVLGGAAQNDSAQQLFVWGVLYGLLSAVFEPITTEITQEMWEVAVKANLHRALSPDELAVMVVRGWMSQAAGEAEAAKAGVAQNDFANMVNNRRNPISPEEAAVALRRRIIPDTAAPGTPSFETAIQEGNLGDQWGPVIKQLATAIPSPADILQAVLEGQIPPGVDPRALYQQVGGQATDPNTGLDYYALMFNTRGSAPTPSEAATMANRGIIPWGTPDRPPVVQGPGAVSFYQAFLEGPWRNKWVESWERLAEYLPPPRTVVTMLRSGALTTEQATVLLEKEGLPPDLAAAYVADATHAKVAGHKLIAEGLVTEMYVDKLISEAEAVAALEDLGYDVTEAGLLIRTAQARQTLADLRKNVTKIGTYFIAHKINVAQASAALTQLGVPADQVQVYIAGWQTDRDTNVKILTPAQVASAVDYGVITEDEGLGEIERLGYTPYDAWILLSIRAKGPLPNRPPPGPPPVQ